MLPVSLISGAVAGLFSLGGAVAGLFSLGVRLGGAEEEEEPSAEDADPFSHERFFGVSRDPLWREGGCGPDLQLGCVQTHRLSLRHRE